MRNTSEQDLSENPRISHALEAAIGTLREQLAQERERVSVVDRRAELAERKADRAEAALAAERRHTDALRSELAAAEAEASRLQAERASADALTQEMLQVADELRRADNARRERNNRLVGLVAVLIGAGVGALAAMQLDDPIDGALIGGVGGGLVDGLLSLFGGERRGAVG
jgi:capsule polysaccharide export protein KpsE/RkpR